MKKVIKRFFRSRIPAMFLSRKDDADLNGEAAKAGSYYLNKKGYKTMDTKERILIQNCVAAGFYMGYRKYEENLGIKDKK